KLAAYASPGSSTEPATSIRNDRRWSCCQSLLLLRWNAFATSSQTRNVPPAPNQSPVVTPSAATATSTTSDEIVHSIAQRSNGPRGASHHQRSVSPIAPAAVSTGLSAPPATSDRYALAAMP